MRQDAGERCSIHAGRSSGRFRIAVLNSHPIQYFAPLYAYLNATGIFAVSALYCSDFSIRGGVDSGFQQAVKWDIDLLKGYPALFLGPRASQRVPRGFLSLIVPEVWGEIRSGRYDALILHGHNFAVNFIALAAAKVQGVRVFMRSETHLGLERSWTRRLFRRPFLAFLYRHIDCFLAIGTANAEFYLAMGVPQSKIVLMPYSVDNERFIREGTLSEEERAAVRSSLGVPDQRPMVLFASKFSRRKHPDDVIRAACHLLQKGLSLSLVMVGSGEMEGELRRLVGEMGLNTIHFAGFINQRELPRVLAACDIFVLPSSEEPWGLVINEAMCAGRPIVISRDAGCAIDLVQIGDNGFTFEAGDLSGLVTALETLVRDEAVRRRMGRRSLERISKWSYVQCAAGLQEAMERVALNRTV